ncbi:MAG TPA: enolase C-terminal domain-like protein, partial [Actinomycetota bacterium]
GGIAESLRIHDLCVDQGVPLWCGGMLESGIGRAANIALASLPGFDHPADMSPAAILYTWDLVDPTYQVDPDGFVDVPVEAGLGFPVDEERVRAQTVRRAELDRRGNVTHVDERRAP